MDRLPDMQELAKYGVNRDQWEGIRQTLYDTQAYAAAGATQLTFFAVPKGQGGKTLSDTNLTLAGQLPAMQVFIATSVECIVYPTAPAVAAANPSAFGAQAVAAQINDAYLLARTGNLELTVGSKPYLQEAPLGRFPGKTHFQVNAALSDSTTVAGNQQSRIAFGYAAGRPYLLTPANLFLTSSQNFTVTLNWPEGVQAITNPCRIQVVLDGFLYRRSQ